MHTALFLIFIEKSHPNILIRDHAFTMKSVSKSIFIIFFTFIKLAHIIGHYEAKLFVLHCKRILQHAKIRVVAESESSLLFWILPTKNLITVLLMIAQTEHFLGTRKKRCGVRNKVCEIRISF